MLGSRSALRGVRRFLASIVAAGLPVLRGAAAPVEAPEAAGVRSPQEWLRAAEEAVPFAPAGLRDTACCTVVAAWWAVGGGPSARAAAVRTGWILEERRGTRTQARAAFPESGEPSFARLASRLIELGRSDLAVACACRIPEEVGAGARLLEPLEPEEAVRFLAGLAREWSTPLRAGRTAPAGPFWEECLARLRRLGDSPARVRLGTSLGAEAWTAGAAFHAWQGAMTALEAVRESSPASLDAFYASELIVLLARVGEVDAARDLAVSMSVPQFRFQSLAWAARALEARGESEAARKLLAEVPLEALRGGSLGGGGVGLALLPVELADRLTAPDPRESWLSAPVLPAPGGLPYRDAHAGWRAVAARLTGDAGTASRALAALPSEGVRKRAVRIADELAGAGRDPVTGGWSSSQRGRLPPGVMEALQGDPDTVKAWLGSRVDRQGRLSARVMREHRILLADPSLPNREKVADLLVGLEPDPARRADLLASRSLGGKGRMRVAAK